MIICTIENYKISKTKTKKQTGSVSAPGPFINPLFRIIKSNQRATCGIRTHDLLLHKQAL